MMATVHYLSADGSRSTRTQEMPTLQEMQAYVGGYIEHVSLTFDGHPLSLIVNEDGRRLGLPTNAQATALTVGRVLGDIVGNAIVIEGGLRDA